MPVLYRYTGSVWEQVGAAQSGTTDLLGITAYAAGSDTVTAMSGTSNTDVDATNMAVAFTAPASGKVLVEVEGLVNPPTSQYLRFQLREASSNVGNVQTVGFGSVNVLAVAASFYITGLTPASAHTYKLGAHMAAGAADIRHGPTYGRVTMKVWACP